MWVLSSASDILDSASCGTPVNRCCQEHRNMTIDTVPLNAFRQHVVKIVVGAALDDDDGADHHLSLHMHLLRPVLLHPSQNLDLW